MTEHRYILEATHENFEALVIGNSAKGTVVVNYWSPRAAPCMMLMPRLTKLAEEYGGRFLLVNVNTDDQYQLARSHGVVSIPNVKIYRHGKVVDELRAAESETSVRRLLERHVPRRREISNPHHAGLRAFQRGDLNAAASQLAEAALEQPENLSIAADLAKVLMAQGQFERARNLLSALPAPARRDTVVAKLLAHLEFIGDAPPIEDVDALEQAVRNHPNDLESRYRLAAAKVVADDYADAMAQLLAIAERDRDFRDDVGRRGLLALFDVLGDNELTSRYRARLQNVIH